MTDLREPPYAADTLAKGWRFSLDCARVSRSAAFAFAKNGVVKGAILLLFLEAWQQEPCATLPNDSEAIRKLIGMRKGTFASNRKALMYDWWLASDGRLYHPLLTEQVLEMLDNRARGWRKHRDEVLRTHGYRCKYCGVTEGLTLDHVMPRSRGGSDEPTNLVPACRICNSSKGARTPEEWRQ